MADVVVDLIDAVDARLRDAANGVNAKLALVDATAKTIGRIYSSWDEVDRIIEPRALFAQHVQASAGKAQLQHRDWVHRFAFWLKVAEPDQAERRKYGAKVAQAVLHCLDPIAEDPNAVYAGANVQEVERFEASTLFQREEDHRDEVLIAVMEIRNREEL